MRRIEKTRDDLRALCRKLNQEGKTIWVYGASTKGNTILQFCGLGRKELVAAADANPFKLGKYVVGADLPIKDEAAMRAAKPDYLLALPYSFVDAFRRREAEARGRRNSIHRAVARGPRPLSLSQTMSEPEISIILPTYNEKGNILDLVSEIKVLLEGRSKEIIVVDDDSPDKTADAVRERFAGDPEVRVIVRTRDRGMANSIREGLDKSRGAKLVVLGSDFNHLPEYIPFMVDALEHYDGVFGSRFLYGSWMSSFVHLKLSWAFNIFIRILLGGSITDNLFGYYAIRRNVIEQCDYDDIFWGFGDYCIRLLYYLEVNRASILQIPMVVGERRAGVGNRAWVRTLIQYLISTIGLTLNKERDVRPLAPVVGCPGPGSRSPTMIRAASRSKGRHDERRTGRVKCSLCGSTDAALIAPLSESSALWSLRAMPGSSSPTSPRSASPWKSLYSEEYFKKIHPAFLLRGRPHSRRQEQPLSLRASRLSEPSCLQVKGGVLLDIGCGTGSFLKLAAGSRGIRRKGVEFSKWASEEARKSGDFEGPAKGTLSVWRLRTPPSTSSRCGTFWSTCRRPPPRWRNAGASSSPEALFSS